MFSSKDVPAVGVSVGIERIFNLLEDKIFAQCRDEAGTVTGKIKETSTQVSRISDCSIIMIIADASGLHVAQTLPRDLGTHCVC